MGLKSLLMVSATLVLPACSHVEVTNVSEKLIPEQLKEAANITQVQRSASTPSQVQVRPKSASHAQPSTITRMQTQIVQNHSPQAHHITQTQQQKNTTSICLTTAAKELLKASSKPFSKANVKKIAKHTRKNKVERSAKIKSIQEGRASYYSNKLHGRKTASGAVYNKNKLTAAHKHLPFGTKVRVINKANGRSVLVSINDRGPFVKKRILDLSYVAAKQLRMLRSGVSNIKMEILQ